jgi:hypothetical protein
MFTTRTVRLRMSAVVVPDVRAAVICSYSSGLSVTRTEEQAWRREMNE